MLNSITIPKTRVVNFQVRPAVFLELQLISKLDRSVLLKKSQKLSMTDSGKYLDWRPPWNTRTWGQKQAILGHFSECPLSPSRRSQKLPWFSGMHTSLKIYKKKEKKMAALKSRLCGIIYRLSSLLSSNSSTTPKIFQHLPRHRMNCGLVRNSSSSSYDASGVTIFCSSIWKLSM